jgi:GNAT superfamily N-acetyltransferase
MTVPLPAARVSPVPAGVDVVHVSDVATLAHHRAVDREAFDDPGVVAETFAPDSILERPNVGLFLALLDGVPVGTSVGVATGKVVGVFGVAVLEAARRRGIGAAVTDAAIAFGAGRGCDLAYLQATPMGAPVYARMGFESVGTYRGYMTPLETS